MDKHHRGALALSLSSLCILASPALRAEPGDENAARTVLSAFLKPGADVVSLTKALRPTAADYKAVFSPDLAKKAEASYKQAWDSGALVIRPNEGQSELKLVSATTEDLKEGKGNAKEFPGGYGKLAPQLNKGLTFYRFKFVEPGKTLGMAYDGLVYVNGHFVIFPKPFRLLQTQAETEGAK